MNELIVLGCILFVSLIGFIIIQFWNLLPEDELFFSLGTSFGLGSGLIALQLYAYSRCGISWNIFTLLTPWVLFIFVVLGISKERFKIPLLNIPNFSLLEKILITGILLTLFYVIIEALIRPLSVWDGWATWLFESKVFFFDGRVSYENMHFMQASYPLLYPLLATFNYIIMESVDDTAILLLSVAFYFFLSLSFFSVLKKQYGIRYALVWTFILMTTQNLIRHGRLEAGIADLPQGYFIFVSSMLFLKYLQKFSQKILILLMIMLGFASLIKNEGTPFLFIMLLLLFYTFYKKKMYSYVSYLLIPLSIWGDWQIFKKMIQVDQIYSLAHPFEMSIHKTANAIIGSVRELFTIKSWNIVWILYFLSFFYNKKRNIDQLYLTIIILVQLSIYFILYLTTYGNNPESSLPRLLIHVLALVVYVLAVQLKERNNRFVAWILG
jgi:hypothetical protein